MLIKKRLQINPRNYGILDIWTPYETFNITIYSYINCGGKCKHNDFSLTAKQGIEVAKTLHQFAISRKKSKAETLLELDQEHKIRGKLFLYINEKGNMIIGIGRWSTSEGILTLSKKQAKKLSGYLFFWAGEKLIGKRKINVSAKTKYVVDI